MTRHGKFYRAIACVMVMLMFYMPMAAFAQSVGPLPSSADTARHANEGQSYGETIAPSDIGSYDNGKVTFPGGGDVSLNELFPDAQSEEGGSSNFPHAQPEGNLKSEASSDPGLNAIGGTALSGMRSEVSQPGGPTSIQGMAYEVIHKAGEQSRPDFSNDPMLNASRDTYENIDLVTEGFSDCSVDEQMKESSFEAHVPDYNQCIRRNKPEGDCTITHHIEIDTEPTDLVFIIDRSASMDSEIAALREGVSNFATLLSQGRSSNLRVGGVAMRNDNHLTMHRKLTYDINAFQNWINGVVTEGGQTSSWNVINWTAQNFNWRSDPEVHKVIVIIGNDDDWGSSSPAVQNLVAKGIDLYVFHNNYTKSWYGTHVDDTFDSRTFMRLAQFFTVVYDYWAPDQCIDDAIATLEEFCDGSYSQYPTNPRDCVDIDGFYVCPGDPIYKQLTAPPIPDVDRLAARVDVTPLTCDYDQGTETCWTDQYGDTQCVSSGEAIEECAQYENDPQCGFVKSECVDGAEGSKGTCYVHDETWDCGESYEIPTLEKEGEYTCAGPIRCMGSECFDFQPEQSQDFARATAMMNAAQHMISDMTCEEGQTGQACTIFKGDPEECKKAVSGTVDCCEKPQGVSLKDYLTLIMMTPKIDSAIMGLEQTDKFSSIAGAYNHLRQPVTDSWSTITSPFTSRLESATGAFDTLKGTVQDAILDAVQPLKDKLAEMTAETIMGAAEDIAMDEAASAAASEGAESFSQQLLGEAGAAMLGNIMLAYQIYVVSMLVIQLIWKCEEEEFELNAKRELKSAHYIGSYCKTKVLGYCVEKRESYCSYNSPLSRIMQEQVRKQLDMSWGTPENPECGGIPVAQLDQVDWDLVNLDEWLGILQSQGLYKGAQDFDLSSITGAGSHLDIDGNRNDAIERTLGRFEDTDIDAFRANSRDEMRLK
ncbi:conjugal transfer mating pair stabilization protein TraN [Halomonas sp. LBP4]|uniref:conjugal transfer mating pair stabilization protein TraN n=1 Tax=Halomonas sp. LBP4 TaxID=2044917 RepID=UPI000D755DAC|nr:conjugal transfer mating pair stabilization protein TraN [Halomonas sp. LBP4]PXX95837.1 conjugal transfer protein TraN [Halomonas sp. LBP4]